MAEPTSAGEALTHFVNSLELEPETLRADRPAVERFVTWFGEQRPLAELTGELVRSYHEQASAEASSDDASELEHVEPLRAFLAYCSRMAFTDENLVPYLQLGGVCAVKRRYVEFCINFKFHIRRGENVVCRKMNKFLTDVSARDNN